jgi:hypothetical protein
MARAITSFDQASNMLVGSDSRVVVARARVTTTTSRRRSVGTAGSADVDSRTCEPEYRGLYTNDYQLDHLIQSGRTLEDHEPDHRPSIFPAARLCAWKEVVAKRLRVKVAAILQRLRATQPPHATTSGYVQHRSSWRSAACYRCAVTATMSR